MKLLIDPSGDVQLVPAGVAAEPPAGGTLRDAGTAELALIAQGGLLRMVAGVLTEVPPPVPPEVPLWRAKAVAGKTAHGEGSLRAAIESLMDGLPGDAGISARAAWHDGNVLVRQSPTLLALAAQLGLSAADLDDFFRQAAALPD